MIVQIEIPDCDIQRDELDESSIQDIIEQGISYMARVCGHYHLESSNITFKFYTTKTTLLKL